MTGAIATTAALSRLERLPRTGSTNDVVRGWLADGVPEVCVAVADEQTAGRGRLGRTWTAPPAAALLLSAGFRPTWIAPDRAWRIGATVALAMCDAAEDTAGLPVGGVRLKWPNDLAVEVRGPHALLTGVADADDAVARLAGPVELRKLAGILGESEGLGTADPHVVVGIGVNADWAAADFPAGIAGSMTSLREASGGRPIDREELLGAFLDHLEARLDALRAGFFDLGSWADRQALTGRLVTLQGAGDGAGEVEVLGVDAVTGALVVRDLAADAGERLVHAGEVVRVRLARDGV